MCSTDKSHCGEKEPQSCCSPIGKNNRFDGCKGTSITRLMCMCVCVGGGGGSLIDGYTKKVGVAKKNTETGDYTTRNVKMNYY